MKTQHTPGPWRIWRDMDPQEPRQIIGPSDDFVCVIDEANTNDDANARLIAAAPELLHACELAFKELAKMGCECDCENLPVHCPLCACRTALDKAGSEKTKETHP